MIESLIRLFMLFSLMFLPVIAVYHAGGTFNEASGLDALLARFSLGNLGHAESYCNFSYLSMKNVVQV